MNKTHIKARYIALTLSSLALVISLFMASCSKEEVVGMPVIKSVRLTDPATAGQSLTSTTLGKGLVIEGTNLGTTKRVYLNDFEYVINPVYATDNNIVLVIDDKTPTVATDPKVTNKIRVVTAGGEASYDFTILPPAPIIDSLSNEFANVGDKITLYGSYFFFIDKVVFPGNVAATSVVPATDGKTCVVTVPAGATTAGNISMTTKSGTSANTAYTSFRDASGVFLDFDKKNTLAPWGPMPIVANASKNSAISNLTGDYLWWNQQGVVAGSGWESNLATPIAGNASNWPAIADNTPLTDLELRFELNVNGVWKSGQVEINMGAWALGKYYWSPWTAKADKQINTNGWTTFRIPLINTPFKTATYADIKGKEIDLFFQNTNPEKGGVKVDVNWGWDNFRIVKIK